MRVAVRCRCGADAGLMRGRPSCMVEHELQRIASIRSPPQLPTCIVYVVDTERCKNPTSFMSNMLYACSILYKVRVK